MWTVVKRILPKSALEKVNFLDTKEALESVFYLDRLPQCKSVRISRVSTQCMC